MRLLLTLALALTGLGCSFYAPTIADCTLSCGEGGACPAGFTCRGTFCRPASGPDLDCTCRAGSTQPCGLDTGECAFGQQTCSTTGEWSDCTGGQGPTSELCDGKDNDCDGLTDLGPVSVVLEGNTGPYEGHWRLHTHDAGYTMVAPLALPDGGAEVRALSFDPRFVPLGQFEVVTTGWRRAESAAEGDTMFVGYYIDDSDVEVRQIAPGGQVSLIGQVLDAGYSGRMQVGTGPLGLVTTWLSTDATVRVAKWPRDGGPTNLYDLAPRPGGEISWVDSTTDGQFAIIEANVTDGGSGIIDAVQHIDEPAPRTLTAPYWILERFRTRGGSIVQLDIIDDNGERVIFWYDYEKQAAADSFLVEDVGRWKNADFIFDDAEDVVAAYVDETAQRLVFASIVGRTYSDLQATRRAATDVVVPSSPYQGNVRLGHVPGDPMFGVFWSTRERVYARRFCAP